MKKQIFAAIMALSFATSVFAIDVNEKELQSAGGEGTVVFENYMGPHKVIETADAIKAIGTGLGNEIRKNIEVEATTSSNQKYTVIHAIDPSSKDKLDADILIINPSATVDHIRNLRRIIAGYLSSAYGYSDKDANTVATFVTVYNAVYRGKIDSFKEKYKDVVTKNLTAEKCGLGLKWTQWPGNSQIVIPLGEFADGGLSSVETSVISDKKVVDSMKEEDDKGIDERKNMVDIKERESEDASAKAQEAAKKASDENKKLEEQKKNQKEAEKTANKKEAEAEKKQQVAEQKKEEAKKDPGNKQKQQDAKKAESDASKASKDAEKARDNANKEAAKTEEQQSKVDEAQNEASNLQAVADKKSDEAQKEREEIAKDQQELANENLKEMVDGTVMGLKVVNEAEMLSSLVKLNGKTGEVVRESKVNVIRNRTAIPVQDAIISMAADVAFAKNTPDTSIFYMAVCGNNSGVVKLCLIDAYKMEIQKESEETLSKNSVLIQSGTNYFVVIEEKGKNYVASYDKQLTLVTKSPVEVTGSTPITVTGKGLVVTQSDGTPVLLSLTDLTKVTQ